MPFPAKMRVVDHQFLTHVKTASMGPDDPQLPWTCGRTSSCNDAAASGDPLEESRERWGQQDEIFDAFDPR